MQLNIDSGGERASSLYEAWLQLPFQLADDADFESDEMQALLQRISLRLSGIMNKVVCTWHFAACDSMVHSHKPFQATG